MFYPNKETGNNQIQNKSSQEHQAMLSKEESENITKTLTNQNALTSLSASTPTMYQPQKINFSDYHQASFNNNLYDESFQFSNDYFNQNSNFDDATNDSDIASFDDYLQFQDQEQYQDQGFPINLDFANDYDIDDSTLTQNQNNPQEQNSFIQSNFESNQTHAYYLSPEQTAAEEHETNFTAYSEIGVSGNRNLTSITVFSQFQNSDSPPDFDFIQDQDQNLPLFPESIPNPNQYDLGQTEDNSHTNDHQSSPCSGSTRSRKRKVELDENASLFKDGFYKVFNKKRKKFPKDLVKKIHNRICEPLNLIKMPREFERSIDLYFKAFSQYSNKILCFLQKNKELLLVEYPELRELK